MGLIEGSVLSSNTSNQKAQASDEKAGDNTKRQYDSLWDKYELTFRACSRAVRFTFLSAVSR